MATWGLRREGNALSFLKEANVTHSIVLSDRDMELLRRMILDATSGKPATQRRQWVTVHSEQLLCRFFLVSPDSGLTVAVTVAADREDIVIARVNLPTAEAHAVIVGGA